MLHAARAEPLPDVAALFVEDGQFRFGAHSASGRAGIAAWHGKNEPVDTTRKHLTTNTVIDREGDAADVVSDFALLGFHDGRLVPLLAGRYREEVRRVGGGWHFVCRDATPLHSDV